MVRNYLLILLAFFISPAIRAQEVESTAYDVMLSTLLDHTVPEISVDEVKNGGVLLLDARAKEEYNVSKIKGARWVGYDDFSLKRVDDLAKDKEIVVYCSVGYRSEKITERLKKAGFHHVSNLYGGIFEWVNQGMSVVDARGQTTQKVHAYDKVWGIWLKEGEKVYD
ncbi:rhodanese-like domain-containing protein [Catalinimonas sp. 4WD22]|uniref:rhodanese-like domain-containing protein n=1 Tax=Catalinimonas locisalis TaxID=3133978 RepID=UPI0031010EA1